MGFWHRRTAALGRWLRLDMRHAQVHYGAVLGAVLKPKARWLEVGCGRQILPDWAMPDVEQRTLAARSSLLVGVDADDAILEHPHLHARVRGLAGLLPFREESFDLVSANMVVEHVADCAAFLGDVRRVLRPGGRFLFHTPNYRYYLVYIASHVPDKLKGRIVWFLERRREEDRFPTHYRINTAPAIRRLAAEAGFHVEEIRLVGPSGAFGRLGPIGLLECFLLKVLQSCFRGRLRSNLICVLRK